MRHLSTQTRDYACIGFGSCILLEGAQPVHGCQICELRAILRMDIGLYIRILVPRGSRQLYMVWFGSCNVAPMYSWDYTPTYSWGNSYEARLGRL